MTLNDSSVLTGFRRRSTADDVADALREAIVSGEIPQGAPLREAALAAELGVGRSPIREALRVLIQEGLVLYEVHRSASVKVLTPADLHDIYVAREAIEPTAIRVIIDSPSIDTTPLANAFDDLRRARWDRKPSAEMVAADVRLHETVVRLSRCPRLQLMFRALVGEWRMYLLQAHPAYDAHTYVTDHEQLVEAIVARRVDAPQLMKEHLESSLDVITSQFVPRSLGRVAVADRANAP